MGAPTQLVDANDVAIGQNATNPLYTTAAGSGTTAQEVQGNVAAGTTDSGNPVKTGGKYNASPTVLSDGQRGDTQVDTVGSTISTLRFANSTSFVPTVNLAVDGSTQLISGLGVSAYSIGFNGATFDRFRTIQGATGTTGLGVAAIARAGSPYAHITTSTNAVKSGAGILERIIINTPGVAGTITLYDNITTTGSVIAPVTTLITSTIAAPIEYGLGFTTGLSVAITGSLDVTVVYR